MEQLYLLPGEERYTKFQDENGVPKVRYTYCSLHGIRQGQRPPFPVSAHKSCLVLQRPDAPA